MEGIWRWQTSRMRRRMLWWWRWSLPNARRLPHLRCEVTVYSPGCSLESCVFSLDRLYFKPDFWIQFVQTIILLTVWIMMLTDGWVEAEQIWCNLPGSCVCVCCSCMQVTWSQSSVSFRTGCRSSRCTKAKHVVRMTRRMKRRGWWENTRYGGWKVVCLSVTLKTHFFLSILSIRDERIHH